MHNRVLTCIHYLSLIKGESVTSFNRWGFDSVSDPVVHSMKISHLLIWYIWYFTES